jgi:hypothetical protein
MTRNRIIILVIGIMAFFSFVNLLILRSLREETKKPTSAAKVISVVNKASQKAQEIPEAKKYPLVPEDPAKYGIISISESQMPQEQLAWDAFMKKAIVDSKILETREGEKAVEKMNTSREEFVSTMEKVDRDIAIYEKQSADNPLDASAEQRLQTLYKLKAIAKAVEEKVTTLAVAPNFPLPTKAVGEASVVGAPVPAVK